MPEYYEIVTPTTLESVAKLATGSNSVEAPKIVFCFRATFSQLLNLKLHLQWTAMVTPSFHESVNKILNCDHSNESY